MRGLDLLIAATLPNPRAQIQVAGRVGRGNEDCKRFIIDSVQECGAEEDQLYSTLVTLVPN